jgi:hypothetical protein
MEDRDLGAHLGAIFLLPAFQRSYAIRCHESIHIRRLPTKLCPTCGVLNRRGITIRGCVLCVSWNLAWFLQNTCVASIVYISYISLPPSVARSSSFSAAMPLRRQLWSPKFHWVLIGLFYADQVEALRGSMEAILAVGSLYLSSSGSLPFFPFTHHCFWRFV